MDDDKRLQKFVAQAMDGKICPRCQGEKPLNRMICTTCMVQIISEGEAEIERRKKEARGK